MGNFFSPQQRNVTRTNSSSGTTNNTNTQLANNTQTGGGTSQLNPFGPASTGLNSGINQLNAAIAGGPFSGPFIGDQSQFTQNALQGFQGLVDGNPLGGVQNTVNSGLNFTNPNLGGLQSFAGNSQLNPFIQSAINAGAAPLVDNFRQATTGLSSQFSNLGRLRGGDANVGEAFGRQQDALARGLGTLSSGISLGAFENDAARRFGAANQLANFGNRDQAQRLQAGQLGLAVNQGNLGNLGALLGAGGVQDSRNQAVTQAGFQQFMNPFNFANGAINAASGPAAQFGTQTNAANQSNMINGTNTINGTQTQNGSNTTPFFGPSPFSSLAGLGLGVAGLSVGGPAGASAGSLGGNFLGGLLGS